jgi:hypothetical protein
MTRAQQLAGLILCGFLSGAESVHADAVTHWKRSRWGLSPLGARVHLPTACARTADKKLSNR